MKIVQNICNISKHGGCCCICEFHITINKHPWNTTNFIKGSMSEFFAYGCAVQFSEYLNKEGSAKPQVIIYDKTHGMCEMFESTKCFQQSMQDIK